MRTIYKITVGAVVGGVVVVVLLSHAVLNTLEAGRPGAAAAADAANAAEGGGILLSSAEWVEGIEETVLEGIQVLRNELDESIAFPGVHEDSRRSGELVHVHAGARQPPVSTPALRDFGFDSRHKQQGGGGMISMHNSSTRKANAQFRARPMLLRRAATSTAQEIRSSATRHYLVLQKRGLVRIIMQQVTFLATCAMPHTGQTSIITGSSSSYFLA